MRPTISDAIQYSYTYKDSYVFTALYSYDQNVIAGFQPDVNVFWSSIGRYNSTIPALNINTTVTFRSELRVIGLTYSRGFGSKTVKAAKNRATGSEEERTCL